MFKWQKAAVKVPFRKGKKKIPNLKKETKNNKREKKNSKENCVEGKFSENKNGSEHWNCKPVSPAASVFGFHFFFLPPPPPSCVFIMKTRSRSRKPAHTSVYTGSRQSDMLLKGQDETSPYREICAVSCGALSSPPL